MKLKLHDAALFDPNVHQNPKSDSVIFFNPKPKMWIKIILLFAITSDAFESSNRDNCSKYAKNQNFIEYDIGNVKHFFKKAKELKTFLEAKKYCQTFGADLINNLGYFQMKVIFKDNLKLKGK